MKNTGGKSKEQILRQKTAELIIAKEEKVDETDHVATFRRFWLTTSTY